MSKPHIEHRPPRWLYRFRSVYSEYFEQELVRALDKELYLAPLASQNDPFECYPSYEQSSFNEVNDYIDAIRKGLGKYVLPTGTDLLNLYGDEHHTKAQLNKSMRRSPSRARRFRDIAEKIYHEQRYKFGIACFCSSVTSQLMWAHYTQGFRGIALVYEWDEAPFLSGDSLNPIKMRYASRRPKLTTIDMLRMGRKDGDSFRFLGDEEYRSEAMDKMYFTKSEDWSYEQEWRIFGFGKTGYHMVNSMVPKAIVLGPNCDKTIMEKIKDIAKNKVEVVPSHIDANEYSLNIPFDYLPADS